MTGRFLLLLLLFCCLPGTAALRPVSSVNFPQEMMPLATTSPWQGKVLRTGILQDNGTPWNMVVGDDLYGINADYLLALTQTSGLRFEVSAFDSQAALNDALAAHHIDIAFGVPQSALPAGLSATQPWFTSPLRIYRSRENPRPVMFNSENARLTISRAALALVPPAFAQKHRWQVVDNDLQALYALINNQSDYVVADETSAGFLLSQLQQGQIYQLATASDPGALHFQAVTADPVLTTYLDRALRQLPMEVVNGIQGRWSSPLPRYQDTYTAHLTPMERQWIAENPVLTYAAIEDDFPWSYRAANGQPAGYSVDLLTIIGQNTGLTFKPWWVRNAEQAQALVAQGRAMLQLALPLTGNDTMRSNTLPVWRSLWGVYVAQHAPALTGWRALSGQKVGVRRGDIARQMLPDFVEPVIFDDSNALYEALEKGQIRALVDNVISARWHSQAHASHALRLAFAASDTAWPVTLGVRPDLPLLRTLLNSSLQQIPVDSQQRLRETWSNNAVLSERGEKTMRPVSVFVLIAALLAILFLLALLIRRYLEQRRERKQRLELELEREEARRANQMKSQFLATVSHELRTPMQAILGLLELEVSRMPANHRLRMIHSSASGLMTLLNDLQDHAKLESGTFSLSPQPLDPQRWLTSLHDFYHPLMRPDAPQFRVEALTTLPASILIDGERLQQIVHNLAGNALRFTAQGEIRVTLAIEADTQQLTLEVCDTGSGIPEAEQSQLFEPWYQTPSGKRFSVQGSGLGLSICKALVTRMGGQIALASSPGHGTTVTVQLPWQPDSGSAPHPLLPARRPVEQMQGLRVAIVDDHPTNLLVMQQQLAWFGIEADCYHDGQAFLRAGKQWDVLLLDFSMPRPNGLTLARIVRRRERQASHRSRVIFCSADAEVLSSPAVSALADGVLLKPVTLHDIETLLTQRFGDVIARLQALAGQESTFFKKVCQTLERTLREDIARLRVAFQDADAAAAEKAAHRLKGSWQMLGYEEGEDACQQVIRKVKAHQFPVAALDLLILLTESLLTEMENYGTHSH